MGCSAPRSPSKSCLALPCCPERGPARVVAGAITAVAFACLPHVLASGAGALGYLPRYLHEEGYQPGHVHRFALLRLALADAAASAPAAVLLTLTGLYVWRRGDPTRSWRGALLPTGATLLLLSPNHPWYSLLVVALVAMERPLGVADRHPRRHHPLPGRPALPRIPPPGMRLRSRSARDRHRHMPPLRPGAPHHEAARRQPTN